MGWAVRKEEELVGGMELDESSHGLLPLQRFAPPLERKDPLDKVLSKQGIIEPSLLSWPAYAVTIGSRRNLRVQHFPLMPGLIHIQIIKLNTGFFQNATLFRR